MNQETEVEITLSIAREGWQGKRMEGGNRERETCGRAVKIIQEYRKVKPERSKKN